MGIDIMASSFNIIFLAILGITLGQECGIGSQCRTLAGVNTCPTCPGGTICIQNTVSSDFYCQYTFCLPQSMMCGGNVGTCCTGLKCGLATLNDPMMTCQPATTTTATTAATAAVTTTPAIIIDIVTATTADTVTTVAPTTGGALCLTDGGAKVGLPCVFPFTNKGVTYTTCTTSGGFDKPWCSTATDFFGNHVYGNFGDCNAACPTEQTATTAAPATCTTTSGKNAGSKCVFPFKYKGVVHTACTYSGGFSQPWCSTKVDYWGRHNEEYWGNCDTNTCAVESRWG